MLLGLTLVPIVARSAVGGWRRKSSALILLVGHGCCESMRTGRMGR